MKRLLFIALGIICYHVVTFAQEVKVEVRGIRSAKGAIMVMAQQDSESNSDCCSKRCSMGKVFNLSFP